MNDSFNYLQGYYSRLFGLCLAFLIVSDGLLATPRLRAGEPGNLRSRFSSS